MLPPPLRVLQLTVPIAEIEHRLRADATPGRADEIRESGADPEAGAAIADLRLPNDGPIDAVAAAVMDWLGWRLPSAK